MSKKKKFKKFSKNMILEELNNEKSDTKEKIKEEKSAKDITPVKNNFENIEEINYVRKDLKKVAFVFSTIICLLVIITIIQARTTWLDNIMDGVIKTLNIN